MSKPTNLTKITLVIDRSGSMEGLRGDVIGGINTFLKEQREQSGDALVTLIQFDDRYEVNYSNVALQLVEDLNTSTYSPRGMTALFDALGRALTDIEADKTDCGHVVVVMTDGHENSSREFNSATVRTKVESAQERGVTILFLGANIDSFAVGGALGISAANTVNYVASAKGMSDVMRSASYATMSIRSGEWADAQAKYDNLEDVMKDVASGKNLK